jgi:hypothetical protein
LQHVRYLVAMPKMLSTLGRGIDPAYKPLQTVSANARPIREEM